MAEEKEILEETETKEETTEQENATVEEQPSVEEQLTAKVKEWEDKYMRLFAEFDNFKKRSEKEKGARYADAVIDTVSELLSVADNIDRALTTEVQSEDAKQLYDGVALVKKQFDDCLAHLEITEIKSVGEQFDPNVHNAIMHIEDESIDDNTIVEEFMKGYIYKGERVVRHPMVKVAN